MRAVMFDLDMKKVVVKKLRLGGKNVMLKFSADWVEPSIKHPLQVKAKSLLSGICGSDLHQVDLEMSYYPTIMANPTNPFPIGHEVIAEIVEVGSDTTKLKVGDRVVYNPIPHCDTMGFELCPSCKLLNWQSCHTLVGKGDGSAKEDVYKLDGKFGGFGGGGFSEYFLGFEKQFYRIPPEMDNDHAVLVEPFVVGLASVMKNPPKDDDLVMVIGAGIIGLMVIAAIRAIGVKCKIICVSRYKFQSELAKQMGADSILSEPNQEKYNKELSRLTEAEFYKPLLSDPVVFGAKGPNLIYDCVATESSMDNNLRIISHGGKIVIVGLGYSLTKKIDWSIQIYKELTIVGVMMYGLQQFKGNIVDPFVFAIDYITKNSTKFDGLVSQKVSIENYAEGLKISRQKSAFNATKVCIDWKQ